jgi:hypothetical protein
MRLSGPRSELEFKLGPLDLYPETLTTTPLTMLIIRREKRWKIQLFRPSCTLSKEMRHLRVECTSVFIPALTCTEPEGAVRPEAKQE